MIWKITVILIAALAVAIAGIRIAGSVLWKQETARLYTAAHQCLLPAQPEVSDSSAAAGLPEPVRNYFAAVLSHRQPLIRTASIHHTGTFNMGTHKEQWKPFTSEQLVVIRGPAFVWNARISMAPLLPAFVHDGYINGEGILHARLAGLISVMDQAQTPELAQGELMRFAAEAVWYPTALLPGRGVTWKPVDSCSAKATFTSGHTDITLLFRFNEHGLIHEVYSEGRYREESGKQVLYPWRGHFNTYKRMHGMYIPMCGEVEWIIDGKTVPYWRACIDTVSYTFVQ